MNVRSRGGNRGRGRVKRRVVESEDGWAVVTHGLSKLAVSSNEGRKAGQLPEVVEGLTVEKMVADFRRMQEQWMDTTVGMQLADLLDKNSHLTITEAVCIGIGSFSRDWEHRHRSMWQAVLFIDVVQRLRKNDAQIKLYAQEPAFTSLDRDFLQEFHINVVDHGVEEHISASTFVFSPFVDWFLLLPMFLKSKTPNLYIGNEILDDYTSYAKTEEKKDKLVECNKLGQNFLEGTDCIHLKDFEKHANALNGMVIYTRSSRDDEDEDPA